MSLLNICSVWIYWLRAALWCTGKRENLQSNMQGKWKSNPTSHWVCVCASSGVEKGTERVHPQREERGRRKGQKPPPYPCATSGAFMLYQTKKKKSILNHFSLCLSLILYIRKFGISLPWGVVFYQLSFIISAIISSERFTCIISCNPHNPNLQKIETV